MAFADTKYAYAVARIRVLETRLLNQVALDRMMGAKNASEAFKVLNDLDYASHSTDIDKVENFQELITIGLKEVKELLDAMTPNPRVLNILWLGYDIHNAKVLIRVRTQKLDEKEQEANILPLGTYSHHLLKRYMDEGGFSERLPQEMRDVLDEALALYEETGDIHEVDQYLDFKYFELVDDIIKKENNAFLREFFLLLLDNTKIKTALRMKVSGQSMSDKYSIFSIPSKLGEALFRAYLGIEKLEDANAFLLDNIKFSQYFDAVSSGLEYFSDQYSFLRLEIELDNMLIKHLQKAKVIPFGPEALIAYFLAKKNNAELIRTIMVGKINETEDKVIKNRLRKLYV